jgi:hypothetical protein
MAERLAAQEAALTGENLPKAHNEKVYEVEKPSEEIEIEI